MFKNSQYQNQISKIDEALRVQDSFDIIKRQISFSGVNATLYLVDGFSNESVVEKLMEFMLSADEKTILSLFTTQDFSARCISYFETDLVNDLESAITAVLSGVILLIIDKFSRQFILIDARSYPSRNIEEPDDDRVLRGAHEGFVETLVLNTALIRRKIRDPLLTMEAHQIGSRSKTDIVLAYMKDKVDPIHLKTIRKEIEKLTTPSLTMAQESLVEALIKKGWYNPFPKVRYTERPDTASASILEGKIVILVDNSPTAIMLPCSIFDFSQDINDFYFPPIVGTYLRWVRFLISFATLFLTPLWFLLVQNPEMIPPWLNFIIIEEPAKIPLLAQLLLFEFAIDGLKLASLNTPSALSNSFSVIGALILGEFAVTAGLFSPQVILYMAFVAIGTFTQPSFELGYAFKIIRILLLVLTALFHKIGFLVGIGILLLLLATNHTVAKKSYLYPFIPFNWDDLSHLLIRRRKRHKKS